MNEQKLLSAKAETALSILFREDVYDLPLHRIVHLELKSSIYLCELEVLYVEMLSKKDCSFGDKQK